MKIQLFTQLLRRFFKKQQTGYAAVPSEMTPRLAVEIARTDIADQLDTSGRRLKSLQRSVREEEARYNELLQADARMSQWLECNQE